MPLQTTNVGSCRELDEREVHVGCGKGPVNTCRPLSVSHGIHRVRYLSPSEHMQSAICPPPQKLNSCNVLSIPQ